VGLGEYLLKRGIVSGLVEYRQSPHATVQDMVGEVSSSKAWATWHGRSFSKTGTRLSGKDSRPLYFSRF
jgi:hypothetical protein